MKSSDHTSVPFYEVPFQIYLLTKHLPNHLVLCSFQTLSLKKSFSLNLALYHHYSVILSQLSLFYLEWFFFPLHFIIFKCQINLSLWYSSEDLKIVAHQAMETNNPVQTKTENLNVVTRTRKKNRTVLQQHIHLCFSLWMLTWKC